MKLNIQLQEGILTRLNHKVKVLGFYFCRTSTSHNNVDAAIVVILLISSNVKLERGGRGLAQTSAERDVMLGEREWITTR